MNGDIMDSAIVFVLLLGVAALVWDARSGRPSFSQKEVAQISASLAVVAVSFLAITVEPQLGVVAGAALGIALGIYFALVARHFLELANAFFSGDFKR